MYCFFIDEIDAAVERELELVVGMTNENKL
jgi:hypothetical protein